MHGMFIGPGSVCLFSSGESTFITKNGHSPNHTEQKTIKVSWFTTNLLIAQSASHSLKSFSYFQSHKIMKATMPTTPVRKNDPRHPHGGYVIPRDSWINNSDQEFAHGGKIAYAKNPGECERKDRKFHLLISFLCRTRHYPASKSEKTTCYSNPA